MSLFSWLAHKPHPVARTVVHGSDRPATRPPTAETRARRKSERAAQRELIYPIVREAMVRAGILSTRYKFKVLSADTVAREFLVMVDMAPEFMDDMARLGEIESLIEKNARARHGLEVKSTYWRVNHDVAPVQHSTGAPARPVRQGESAVAQRPRSPAPATAPANYAMLTGYENTQLMDADDKVPVRNPTLSTTQYGDLS
jgi:hypothetical protein